MSRQINQPINQVKLTNVAVVRCNKAGKRFEIACYRNKVMDYRAGLERDLSEVLQTERIFTNVSKGQFAKSADLVKAFGTADEEEIAQIILQQGKSIQVSDMERHQQIANATAQIASWVAANCVHAESGRPYTVSQIKHALSGFTVQVPNNHHNNHHNNNSTSNTASSKSSQLKKQCLDAVKYLKQHIPIARAKMELSLQYNAAQHQDTVTAALQGLPEQDIIVTSKKQPSSSLSSHDASSSSASSTTTTTTTTLVLQVDPALYRQLDELSKQIGGNLEILQQVVQSTEGNVDLDLDVFMARQKTAATALATTSTTPINTSIVPTKTKTTTTPDQHDDTAADVKQVSEAVENLNLDPQEQDDNSQGNHNDNGDDDDDNNDETFVLADRKSQKKAAKKAKKAQRRKVHDSMATMDSPKQQQQQQQQGDETTGATASTVANTGGGATNGQPPTGSKSCNTCGGAFMSTADYRAHFRSDWHRFNQKLKLQNRAPVSEKEFQLCDAETFFGQLDD